MIASIAVVPTLVLLSPSLSHYPAAVVVAPIASGFGVMVALFWLIRWPTRVQSMLYSLIGSVCIAAACLVQGDPLAGLLGCSAFAMLGGYIALFHTAVDMIANFAIAITTGAVLMARLLRHYDAVVAGSGVLLVESDVAFKILEDTAGIIARKTDGITLRDLPAGGRQIGKGAAGQDQNSRNGIK